MIQFTFIKISNIIIHNLFNIIAINKIIKCDITMTNVKINNFGINITVCLSKVAALFAP